jgi:hypothetical protein
LYDISEVRGNNRSDQRTLSCMSSTILFIGTRLLVRACFGLSPILNALCNGDVGGLGVGEGDSPNTTVIGKKRVAMTTLWLLYELMMVDSKAERAADVG